MRRDTELPQRFRSLSAGLPYLSAGLPYLSAGFRTFPYLTAGVFNMLKKLRTELRTFVLEKSPYLSAGFRISTHLYASLRILPYLAVSYRILYACQCATFYP